MPNRQTDPLPTISIACHRTWLDDNIVCFSQEPQTSLTETMILKTHIPGFPLNQFIDSFIYYEGYHPEHSIDRFLPDGNTEIIIDFDDRPQHIYDNQTRKEIQACRHVLA